MIMEREVLRAKLAAGMSMAAIGREVGLDGSTISYWVEKHGLKLSETARHAPRGAVPEDVLRSLISEGRTTREIATAIGRSQTATRHWLARYGLRTAVAVERETTVGAAPKHRLVDGTCPRHGSTRHALRRGGAICVRCRSEATARWRRSMKRRLVAEAGGRCAACGYDRCVAALHFHHLDPNTKRFALGGRGMTRSAEALRAEVAKCVLLCANCHAEVEAGERELS